MLRFFRRRNTAPAVREPGPDVEDILRDSGLFDEDWYRLTYADVAASGADPLHHYVTSGNESRNPNPFFDTAWYLATYPDVREAGVNPLLHYVSGGAAEGRMTGPNFDTAYYLAENPEVGAAGINPLLHFMRHGRKEGRLATPFDETEAFEAGVRAKAQGLGGGATALFAGPRADKVHFPLEGRSPPPPGGGLPLPPLRLSQRIGSVTLQDFEESGRGIRDAIVRAMPPGFSWQGIRCLDFGSGVGRALRHFGAEARQGEFWGCDIDGSSIRWSVENLSPPFRFFQITEVPIIPFEDNSFDLVYAISVLSHIHSTWHQWLMEIRRILKPGGVFFVSFMGQAPMEEMLGKPYWDRGDDFGMYVKAPHQNWAAGGPMIFVSPAWVQTFWGSLFDIDYIAMDGLMEYQSFCVLRKPAPGSPIREGAPVLKLSTQQAFSTEAIGRIMPQIDPSRHYRESFGIDLSAGGPSSPGHSTRIEGWVAFRHDSPQSAELLVDGAPYAAHVEFETGQPYRDWAGIEDILRGDGGPVGRHGRVACPRDPTSQPRRGRSCLVDPVDPAMTRSAPTL